MTYINSNQAVSAYFPPPPPPDVEAEEELKQLLAILSNPDNPPSPGEVNKMITQLQADYRELMNDPTFKNNPEAQKLFETFFKLFPNAGLKDDIPNYLASLKDGVNAKLISELTLYIANVQHGTIH